jgi:hypothetical protein
MNIGRGVQMILGIVSHRYFADPVDEFEWEPANMGNISVEPSLFKNNGKGKFEGQLRAIPGIDNLRPLCFTMN